MKKPPIFFLFLLLTGLVWAQQEPRSDYRVQFGDSPTQAKNVYFLNLIEQQPKLQEILIQDVALTSLAQAKLDALAATLVDCGDEGLCYAREMGFAPAEIEQVAQRIAQLASQSRDFAALASDHLAPSGMYQMNAAADPAVFLANAWRQDAQTVNHIIHVYARGAKSNYPNIDSLGMKLDSRTYSANIQALNELAHVKYEGSKLFYKMTLGYAMDALEMARFERAGDFEPMTALENKAAYEAAKRTDWEKFDYPLILIPGAGTDNYLDSLSSGGVLRCQLAFEAYKRGKAPFIMVSGGYVHPYKVLRNEAVEMKRYLLKLGVPESAILIEPHARHTTTNMRNAARIMYRYGFPMDRPSVTITTPAQSRFIYGMMERCMRELGYLPYTNGKRVSATTLEFNPQLLSLQIDTDEPLDP
ncbi:YdcF family protein [Algoriphagus sp. H41]|uniref:YdcF family protein n=1 Tax=Algoriphagus oliviformis TaxID=2811231 RepID=A0ABS3CAE3_9BACT|nr:YdcF family protein [Algoriphagus oliviformis]MBN7813121.1 YdcF family protein [Algoriphagus oliviformis]